MANREEVFHHTDEQLADYIRRATEACDSAELDPGEREAVLPQLVLLAAQKTIYEAPPAHLLTGALDLTRRH